MNLLAGLLFEIVVVGLVWLFYFGLSLFIVRQIEHRKSTPFDDWFKRTGLIACCFTFIDIVVINPLL